MSNVQKKEDSAFQGNKINLSKKKEFKPIDRAEYQKAEIIINNSKQNLPAKMNDFIGREEYLKQIEDILKDETKKIVTLCSFAGTGKTSLANEYGHRFKEKSKKSNIVYWIKSDANNSDHEIQKLASGFNIFLDEKLKTDRDFLARQIRNKLFQSKNKSFLFIFDNCDDYEAVRVYVEMFSYLENVKILITTRNPVFIQERYEKITVQIKLEPFNETESIDYLFVKLKNKTNSKDEIKELAKVLHISLETIRPIVLDRIINFVNTELADDEFASLDTLISELNAKEQFDPMIFYSPEMETKSEIF